MRKWEEMDIVVMGFTCGANEYALARSNKILLREVFVWINAVIKDVL